MAKTLNYSNLDKVAEIAGVLRLLSDPTRFRILCCLIEHSEGMCVFELAEELDVSHSAMSHQLNRLEDRGIVGSFREGQSVCYQLEDTPAVRRLRQIITLFDRS